MSRSISSALGGDMYIPVRVAVGILTACCCSVVGCTALFHPASESVVIVSGRVADVQPSSMCNLYLYKENGKLARQATVASEFKTSLTIAPGEHKYYIEVSCPDHSGQYRSELHTLGGTRTVDLGTVVLKE